MAAATTFHKTLTIDNTTEAGSAEVDGCVAAIMNYGAGMVDF